MKNIVLNKFYYWFFGLKVLNIKKVVGIVLEFFNYLFLLFFLFINL